MHEEKGHPPTVPGQASQDPIEELMGAGELPVSGQAAAPKVKARDLGSEALAAAMAAQPAASFDDAGALDGPASAVLARAPRREWIWRGLLVLNLGILAAVVALPSHPTPPGKADDPARGSATERRNAFALSEQAFYLRALELAGEGKFDDSIAVLEGYLKANPDLVEVEQRLIYNALAMFAVRAGRSADASRYEAAVDRLRVGAQLPQDLLDLARQAEVEGRGADMRRYYARFLLQHKQVPPSLRARIAEAYLKLGDGYRIEAEQGAEREAASKRAAEDAGPSRPDGKRAGAKETGGRK